MGPINITKINLKIYFHKVFFRSFLKVFFLKLFHFFTRNEIYYAAKTVSKYWGFKEVVLNPNDKGSGNRAQGALQGHNVLNLSCKPAKWQKFSMTKGQISRKISFSTEFFDYSNQFYCALAVNLTIFDKKTWFSRI